MKPQTRKKIKRFFCDHSEKDVTFYRGEFWDVKDVLANVLGGNALKHEKCKKCGKEWESEGWYLPPSMAARLKEK